MAEMASGKNHPPAAKPPPSQPPPAKHIRLGTRGSRLARTQTTSIARQLATLGYGCQQVIIKTEGDDTSTSLANLKHGFIKNLEKALLAGEIDLAVHSLKDLPAKLEEPFELALLGERATPYDCLITNNPKTNSPSTNLEANLENPIGTDSLRRKAQLGFIARHLTAKPIRGNIETRLKKLASGGYNGIILAACALERLALISQVATTHSVRILNELEFVPSGGQGIVAVEGLKFAGWQQKLREIDNPASRQMATAERAFLHRLGASCHTPVGAYARLKGGTVKGGELTLRGFVGDGTTSHLRTLTATDPAKLGITLAEQLLAQGSEEFWAKIL